MTTKPPLEILQRFCACLCEAGRPDIAEDAEYFIEDPPFSPWFPDIAPLVKKYPDAIEMILRAQWMVARSIPPEELIHYAMPSEDYATWRATMDEWVAAALTDQLPIIYAS
jgi:hypothetical protein